MVLSSLLWTVGHSFFFWSPTSWSAVCIIISFFCSLRQYYGGATLLFLLRRLDWTYRYQNDNTNMRFNNILAVLSAATTAGAVPSYPGLKTLWSDDFPGKAGDLPNRGVWRIITGYASLSLSPIPLIPLTLAMYPNFLML